MPVVYPVMNPSQVAPNPPSQALDSLKQLYSKKPNPNRLTETRNDEGRPNPYQQGTPFSRNRG